jgi:hypothetical protein
MFRFMGLLALVLVAVFTAAVQADTISVDKNSPLAAVVSPADLLNPGPSVQVPAVNLGLLAADELDGLSSGVDAVSDANILFFSVDRVSQGKLLAHNPADYWDVRDQAVLNQQAGDVYVTINASAIWSAPSGMNMLHTNQKSYGLTPAIFPSVANAGLLDNLDALSFEEFDVAGTQKPGKRAYLSLGNGSPSLGAGSGADILWSLDTGGGLTTGVFATFALAGLLAGDDIDALALIDLNYNGTADPGDKALFSLAPGSPTLLAGPYSAADIFYTTFNNSFSVKYTADSLGLLFDDNVDALEVQLVPEPATLALLLVGAAAALRFRRR